MPDGYDDAPVDSGNTDPDWFSDWQYYNPPVEGDGDDGGGTGFSGPAPETVGDWTGILSKLGLSGSNVGALAGGLGLAGLLGNAFGGGSTDTGYKGGIPNLVANREMLPIPTTTTNASGQTVPRRPGSGGVTYFSPMKYSQYTPPAPAPAPTPAPSPAPSPAPTPAPSPAPAPAPAGSSPFVVGGTPVGSNGPMPQSSAQLAAQRMQDMSSVGQGVQWGSGQSEANVIEQMRKQGWDPQYMAQAMGVPVDTISGAINRYDLGIGRNADLAAQQNREASLSAMQQLRTATGQENTPFFSGTASLPGGADSAAYLPSMYAQYGIAVPELAQEAYKKATGQDWQAGSKAPTGFNAQTGQYSFAQGGIASLGYAKGRLLDGPGDGVSDSIPATIDGTHPAALADGEYIVPARLVSELGNGSTKAGAQRLDEMMRRIQHARKKSIGKNNVAVDSKAYKHLPA